MRQPPALRQIGAVEEVWLGIRRRWRPIAPAALPTVTLRHLRLLSDDDLLIVTAGWMVGSAQRMACDAEIKRREGRTARLALAISFLSLVVSIAASFARHP